MDIFKILQDELQIGYKQVEAAVQLIDEGKHHSVHCPLPQRGNRFFE